MQQDFIELGGCNCCVAQWNPQQKLVAIALHGWLDNLASFETLAKAMPNVRLIALDFPGHGRSAHLPKGQNYHFIDSLYLLDALIAYYQLSQVNIIGHSMGGAIACLYAAIKKNQVANLVLLDCLGPLTVEPDETYQLMCRAVEQRAVQTQKKSASYQNFQQIVEARAKISNISPQLIAPIVERSMQKTEKGYVWRSDAKLKLLSPTRLSEDQLSKLLIEIECRVLLIEATNGLLAKDKQQQRKKYFKNITIKQLDAGHHLHLQQPQTCGQLISEFLTEKSAGFS